MNAAGICRFAAKSAFIAESSEDFFGTLKIIEDQSWLGATDIGAIELDATSRDDIPAILIGLQAVWADEATRAERQCKRTQRERKPLHQFQPLRAA